MKNAKKEKFVSKVATASIEAAQTAGVVTKELKHGGVVIKLESFKEFISKLPAGKTEAVRAFRQLVDAAQKATKSDKGTFIIRPSGSFTLYSRFAE